MAVGKVNRKQRKELARQLWSANQSLEEGIDADYAV
jgi:hypothetical protein